MRTAVIVIVGMFLFAWGFATGVGATKGHYIRHGGAQVEVDAEGNKTLKESHP